MGPNDLRWVVSAIGEVMMDWQMLKMSPKCVCVSFFFLFSYLLLVTALQEGLHIHKNHPRMGHNAASRIRLTHSNLMTTPSTPSTGPAF